MTSVNETPGNMNFILRPIFTREEAEDILAYDVHVTPLQGGEMISPDDILVAVATALREKFYSIGYEQFENVSTYAIG